MTCANLLLAGLLFFSVHKGDINFRINHNQDGLNASTVAAKAR